MIDFGEPTSTSGKRIGHSDDYFAEAGVTITAEQAEKTSRSFPEGHIGLFDSSCGPAGGKIANQMAIRQRYMRPSIRYIGSMTACYGPKRQKTTPLAQQWRTVRHQDLSRTQDACQ